MIIIGIKVLKKKYIFPKKKHQEKILKSWVTEVFNTNQVAMSQSHSFTIFFAYF